MKAQTTVAVLTGILVLTGCQGPHPASQTVPSVINLPTALTKVFAGNEIKLTLKPFSEELNLSSKAEVSLDNSVQALMTDAPIDSVKTESKVVRSNGNLVVSIPTTDDFKPGIWHVSSMRFFDPKKKTWKTYKEGLDYAGTPIQIVNDKKISSDKPSLEIYDIQAAPLQ